MMMSEDWYLTAADHTTSTTNNDNKDNMVVDTSSYSTPPSGPVISADNHLLMQLSSQPLPISASCDNTTAGFNLHMQPPSYYPNSSSSINISHDVASGNSAAAAAVSFMEAAATMSLHGFLPNPILAAPDHNMTHIVDFTSPIPPQLLVPAGDNLLNVDGSARQPPAQALLNLADQYSSSNASEQQQQLNYFAGGGYDAFNSCLPLYLQGGPARGGALLHHHEMMMLNNGPGSSSTTPGAVMEDDNHHHYQQQLQLSKESPLLSNSLSANLLIHTPTSLTNSNNNMQLRLRPLEARPAVGSPPTLFQKRAASAQQRRRRHVDDVLLSPAPITIVPTSLSACPSPTSTRTTTPAGPISPCSSSPNINPASYNSAFGAHASASSGATSNPNMKSDKPPATSESIKPAAPSYKTVDRGADEDHSPSNRADCSGRALIQLEEMSDTGALAKGEVQPQQQLVEAGNMVLLDDDDDGGAARGSASGATAAAAGVQVADGGGNDTASLSFRGGGGKAAGKKGPPAKNLMAERRRRKKLNDRLYTLRSVVPKITKMDRASILGDAIEYLKELLQRINDLHNELEATAPAAPDKPNSNMLNSATLQCPPATPIGCFQLNQSPLTPTSSAHAHHQLVVKEELGLQSRPSSAPDPNQPPKVEVRAREGRALNIHMLCAKRQGLLLATMRALDGLGLDVQQAVISCFNGFALDVFRAEQSQQCDVAPEEIKRVLLLTAAAAASTTQHSL